MVDSVTCLITLPELVEVAPEGLPRCEGVVRTVRHNHGEVVVVSFWRTDDVAYPAVNPADSLPVPAVPAIVEASFYDCHPVHL